MIGALRGAILAIGEDSALIDVQGVGYVVIAGQRTLTRLAVADTAMFHIETHVREDAIRLFGFLSEEERAWFVHLQSVPGVGARVALAILDVLPPRELAEALALGDRKAIERAQGVGPKLAVRLAQELSGKTPPRGFLALDMAPTASRSGPAVQSGPPARQDAVSALLNLGYDSTSAQRAVAQAGAQLGAGAELSALIRAALKELSAK